MFLENGIKLIVGLGNPGLQYEDTRHNIGFWLVKLLAEKYCAVFKAESKFKGVISKIRVNDYECELLLPQTFMNLSGEAVGKFMKFYKIDPESLLVVHDELDFSPGAVRLKKDGGTNGHNGLQSIVNHLGSRNFWRLRIGIGRPKIKDEMSGYVLSSPKKYEIAQIDDAINRAVAIVPRIVVGDFAKAMLELHTS